MGQVTHLLHAAAESRSSMTEQCHHYSSTTGQRCTNKAVVKVAQDDWTTYACSEHRVLYEEHYRQMYKVQPVK